MTHAFFQTLNHVTTRMISVTLSRLQGDSPH